MLDTKSKEGITIPDTLSYVVNFVDNEGFAVLAGDRRLSAPVLCITESGSLKEEDFQEAIQLMQTGTKAATTSFFESGDSFVPILILSSSLSKIYGTNDRGEDGGDIDYDSDYPFLLEDEEFGGSVCYPEPLGPFVMTKWTQSGDPFDRYTPHHYYAGCTCIALAQLLVANRFSNTMVFNGVTCNWDEMEGVVNYSNYQAPNNNGSSIGKEQVANLIAALGSSYYLNNEYNSNGTHPTPCFLLDWGGRLELAMDRLGYSVNREHCLFNFTNSMKRIAYDLLKQGSPAIVQGWAFSSGSGHTWLIDGYRYTYTGHFFHINWGWNGHRDGYYNLGVFNSNNGVFSDSIYDDPSLLHSGGVANNYNVDFAIIDYSF